MSAVSPLPAVENLDPFRYHGLGAGGEAPVANEFVLQADPGTLHWGDFLAFTASRHRRSHDQEQQIELFETYEDVNLPERPTLPAPSSERSKDEVLLTLLRLEPDTLEHLHRSTGWDRAVTQRTLLQLVADGKVRCTSRNNVCWYSVRGDQPGGAEHPRLPGPGGWGESAANE